MEVEVQRATKMSSPFYHDPLLPLKGEPLGARKSRMHRLPCIRAFYADYSTLTPQPMGSFSLIWLSEDGKTVMKSPRHFYLEGCSDTDRNQALGWAEDSRMLLETEKAIYKLIGHHPDILQPLEYRKDGIVMPYYKNGPLRNYLKRNPSVPFSTRMRWALSSLRAFRHIHSKGVLQCDVSARNFLVTDDLNIVLCDLAGSLSITTPNEVRAETRYQKVKGREPLDCTLDTEIFAVGSLLYEICTGKTPYSEATDEEVESLYRERRYPSTADVVIGDVIQQCWMGSISSVEQAISNIVANPQVEAATSNGTSLLL